jgi:hypothetical protein
MLTTALIVVLFWPYDLFVFCVGHAKLLAKRFKK